MHKNYKVSIILQEEADNMRTAQIEFQQPEPFYFKRVLDRNLRHRILNDQLRLICQNSVTAIDFQ